MDSRAKTETSPREGNAQRLVELQRELSPANTTVTSNDHCRQFGCVEAALREKQGDTFFLYDSACLQHARPKAGTAPTVPTLV